MKIRFKSSIQLRKLVGVILLVCGLLLYGERRVSGAETEGKATIIVFDAPGASTVPFQGGTFPTAINPTGAIVGYYYSTVLDQFGNNIPQAFLRASNGTFRSFDPKGSLAALGAPGGSKAFGINLAGAITGYYYGTDAYGNSVTHCFLRAPDGTFTNVDPPGSLGSNDQNPIVINPTWAIAGNYADPSTGLYRGFLRYPNGMFVNIDPPNSNSSNGTAPQAINPTDAVTGYFQDTNAFYPGFRAFLWTPNGTITVFDPPEDVASPGSEYIVPSGINPAGVIAGSYQPQYGQPFYHGFLRAPNGTFTVIDLPNSASNQGTFIFGINPKGTVTGNYFLNNAYHGYVRTRNGTVTTFDPTGATGTSPAAINPAGEVTGNYADANGIHGFVRIPAQQDE
jgi:hypothetical protein